MIINQLLKNENKRISILIILILILLLIGIIYFWIVSRNGGLSASGTIEAVEIEISTKVGGTVEKLLINEGSNVKKDDLLLVLSSRELKAGFQRAQAQIDLAQAQFEVAQKDFNRIKSLYMQGMVSKQQYDATYSLYKSGQANLDQAQAIASTAKIQLDDAQITSPLDGVVLIKAVEIGELASPGSVLLTLADLRNVRLKVYIPEREVGKVRLGQEASINVDAYSNKVFKGKVIHIADKAEFTPKNIQTKQDRVNQVFAIKISIPNPKLELKPGMPADAHFENQ